MHFGTDFDDFTAILLLLQSSFYIGNCYNQCNILILEKKKKSCDRFSFSLITLQGSVFTLRHVGQFGISMKKYVDSHLLSLIWTWFEDF